MPQLSSSIIVIWNSVHPVNLSEVVWESFKYSACQLDTGLTQGEQCNISPNQCSVGYNTLIISEDNKQKQRDYALTHREIKKILPLYFVFIFRAEERQIAYFTWEYQHPGDSLLLLSQSCHFKAKALTVRFHCSVPLLIQLDWHWTMEIKNTTLGHELYILILSLD